MDIASLTKERLVALVVIVAQVALAVAFSHFSATRGTIAGLTVLLSVPGLIMIWFREPLSVIGFDRGVLRDSPPLLIDFFGWLFLIGLPILFLYGLVP